MTCADSGSRPLTANEFALIEQARAKARILYAGKEVPHHSCGASLAVTFSLSARPYQSLRRGGITGERFCGSIRAGEMVLGEILGDESPTGSVSQELRGAMIWFQSKIPKRFDRGSSPDYSCNNLTVAHGDFMGDARKSYCTNLTGEVAALTTEALIRFGADKKPTIIPLGEK